MVRVEALLTPRLLLEPLTLELVEAVFRSDRDALERLIGAKVPAAWPGKALVERAFSASLDAIRADPEKRLWGDRLIISRRVPGQPEKLEPPSVRNLPTTDDAPKGARLLLGSVIFHGRPDDGVAEVGYGVEESWQRIGVASEATRACVEWALAQEGIKAVTATTPPWHTASIRVLERAGLSKAGVEDHEILGEVLRFTRAR